MGKIHELSALLANQIAAGEVIERPASVVKELVENSIDANANQIQIIIQDAGSTLIRIVDNGDGIAKDDVALAFKRHATSKITNRHDLFAIMSLGFRGEALPSIASVADVVIQTKTQDDDAGVELHVRGGENLNEIPYQNRIGTTLTVRELFYNTPARLKYLKSAKTELSKITDVINRLALSYTNVAFSLEADGKTLVKTSGNGQLQQVIASIYGMEVAQKMLAISGQSDDFTVSGFVSKPELTRASREYLTILVNGRYVKNFSVSNAIVKGFGSKLMVGRFPMGVIHIQTDPLLIDVNVHPQKAEIRLTKELELEALLVSAITNRLKQENLIPDAYQNLYGTTKTEFEGEPPVENNEPISIPTITPDHAPLTIVEKRDDLTSDPVHNLQQTIEDFVVASQHDYESLMAAVINEPTPTLQVEQSQLFDEPTSDGTTFPKLQYIGQMHGTFLFAQGESGLYLIDQHAAQERVKYEYYRQKLGEVSSDQQELLTPIVLEYAASDMLKIEAHQSIFEDLGLHLETFGPTSIIVRSHPTWFEKNQEKDTLLEMIDWVLKDGRLTVAQFREQTAIMMSCKRAIKANHHLDNQQAIALIEQLEQAENPYNCPHGRPVVTNFTIKDMEKMFKRIQDSHEPWINYDNHPF